MLFTDMKCRVFVSNNVYALPHERSQGEQQERKRRAEVGANAGNSRSDRLRLDWILHKSPLYPQAEILFPWVISLWPPIARIRKPKGDSSWYSESIGSLNLGHVCKIHHPITILSAQETLARHTEVAYAPRGYAPPSEAKMHQNWTRLIPGRHFRLSEMP